MSVFNSDRKKFQLIALSELQELRRDMIQRKEFEARLIEIGEEQTKLLKALVDIEKDRAPVDKAALAAQMSVIKTNADRF